MHEIGTHVIEIQTTANTLKFIPVILKSNDNKLACIRLCISIITAA